MKFSISKIFVTNRLFVALGIIAILFAVSFSVSFIFYFAQAALILLGAIIIVDLILLFSPNTKIKAERRLSNVFSLSDENAVHITILSRAAIPLDLHIIDELPYQLQKRDFAIDMKIGPGEKNA